MPVPLRAPRLNNNDDTVKLSAVLVDVGAPVRAGDVVCEVETDKATHAVESDAAGFIIAVTAQVGETVPVGEVIAWIGATADEPVPQSAAVAANAGDGGASGGTAAVPTLKASLLLARYGLRAEQVRASADRLSAEDVERHVRTHGLAAKGNGREPGARSSAGEGAEADWPAPTVATRAEPLSTSESGMLRSVLWHQRVAVPGYVEISYDPAPWDEYARAFQERHRLLLSPLLALLAYQLARVAASRPKVNAVVHGGRKLFYERVNLGFTVQSAEMLYLTVVEGADTMTPVDFVTRLGDMQRRAMKHRLESAELTGATVAFTSMARWKVMRHVPVLPPLTSIIVAHSAPANGVASLGASYDHRLLTGGDAVAVLNEMREPRIEES